MSLPLFLLAMALAPAPGAVQTEMLGTDVPDSFIAGNHVRNALGEIIELVQPPETVNDWSKLITLQTFFGKAQIGLDTYYGRWRDGMRRACPGLTDAPMRGSVDAHPAIRSRVSCPLNPQTGRPEMLDAIIVQGEANLMLAQVAFRHAIAPADQSLITRIVSNLKVCDQRAPACVARKPTGFQPAR